MVALMRNDWTDRHHASRRADAPETVRCTCPGVGASRRCADPASQEDGRCDKCQEHCRTSSVACGARSLRYGVPCDLSAGHAENYHLNIGGSVMNQLAYCYPMTECKDRDEWCHGHAPVGGPSAFGPMPWVITQDDAAYEPPPADTQAELQRAVAAGRRHRVEGFTGAQVACECDRRWVSRDAYADHVSRIVAFAADPSRVAEAGRG